MADTPYAEGEGINMRGAVVYAPADVRFEERDDPRIIKPTDATLVATSDVPSNDLIPNLLALSDVMGTGWFAAEAANVKPGKTVAVVGDGAVGLLGVLSAKQMGAERIIAMSRHESRQKL